MLSIIRRQLSCGVEDKCLDALYAFIYIVFCFNYSTSDDENDDDKNLVQMLGCSLTFKVSYVLDLIPLHFH